MAHPPDRAAEPLADLPNPELNPLLNPILGRHLGRWAQVYFTTPIEKRDQAIYDLLRDLEEEEAAGAGPESDSLSQGPREDMTILICERCHHLHTKVQNFCGMCGAPLPRPALHAEEHEAPVENRIVEDPVPPRETPREAAEAADRPNLEGLLTPGLLFDPHHVRSEPVQSSREENRVRARDERHATSRSMIYTDDPEPRYEEPRPAPPVLLRSFDPPDHEESGADIDWIRERSFASDLGGESSGVWKVVIVLGVLAVIGGFAYFRMDVLRPAAVHRPAITSTEQSSNPDQSIAGESSPSSESPTAKNQQAMNENPAPGAVPATPKAAEPATGAAHRNPQTAPANTEARPPAPAPQEPASAAGPTGPHDGGTVELAQAEKYLSGAGAQRNSAVAASLLWKAVAKENSTASMLLSDLYAAGDGVPKNCEQARMLLNAALRKNVPGAANRLQNLQKSCQ